MAGPFTITSVSNYNANPPSDDGSQTASNRVQWSTQKTKLADPIFNAFNSSETNTSAAFGKIRGGAGFTSTGVNYTVAAGDQGKTVKATAAGITITTPDATVVGSPFLFGFLNNSTGDIVFSGNGSQTVDGDNTFTVPAGCGFTINTDGSNWFTDGRNWIGVLTKPEGYLTLSSDPFNIQLSSDAIAATSVYYSPSEGDKVPISTDGSTFKMRQFSQLTLTLNANHLANTLYDVFLFDVSGVITIGTGVAWNNSAAGTCARGTGALTTELNRLHGLPVSKQAMTMRNGATTYSIAANQGTYIGSIFIDSVAGQVTCHRSYGQSRKWGVWNAYNRQPIYLKAGDSTASWSYNSGTVRASNNNSANSLSVFVGLAEEIFDLKFQQLSTFNGNSTSSTNFGSLIGVNSTTTASGFAPIFANNITVSGTTYAPYNVNPAEYLMPPSLGINTINALETGAASLTPTFFGTEAKMLLSALWRG